LQGKRALIDHFPPLAALQAELKDCDWGIAIVVYEQDVGGYLMASFYWFGSCIV
jgi:hypothetical protein